MIICALTLLISLAAIGTAASADGWEYRKNITIDHDKVDADLTNFPVLINITDADLMDRAQPDSGDIVFTSEDNSIGYEHEIRCFNDIQNLLENPGAETGDLSGWTITADGGNGWNVRGSGYEGSHSFSTSYNWCKRYQEIDLLANGYTEAELDAAPLVIVGEWFAGYGSEWDDPRHHNDYCYLKVELRDENHTIINSYDSGVFQTSNGTGWYGPWEQRSHTFSGYGSGLRSIYFEDGGKDWEYWAGRYGPALDATSVTVTPGSCVPDDYTTIQAAVDNATAGDTIIVRDGNYNENVNVNKRLTIRSENGSANCIVTAATSSDHVFEVTADYVNITGFTVKGATSYKKAGIYLDGAEHCYISDLKASNNDYGIYLDHSRYNNLTKNTASNNYDGIYLLWSSNNNLTNNTASNNYDGICLCASSSNNLTGNTFANDGLFLSSGYPNTVENNTVNGKPLVYLEDTSDYMVPDAGQVILVNCNNVTVENQDLSNTTVGVELWGTTNSTITNNTVSNSNYGIYMDRSSNNTLTNNTANSNNDYGIYLSSSSNNNNLTSNTVSSNNYGIYLRYSSNNTLNNNTMSGNAYNFGVYSGSLSGYTQNIDTSNTVDGKPVYYWINQQDKQIPDDAGYVGVVNSTNITVKDLTLSHNGKGVLFVYTTNSNIENVSASNNYYGIYLESSSNNNLSGNTANSNNHDGILLDSSINNTLTSNNASNNGFGIWLYYSSNYSTLTNNNASNNRYGIYLYSSNNTLTNNTANSNDNVGIGLWTSSNNTLTSNTVSSNDYGIWLSSSSNNTLTNNTANSNNHHGIALDYSSNNTLTNNTVSSNDYGIGLYSSNNNLIYNNYFNNTNNARNNGYNIWNITKTAGTNIIGGAYMGGNYWSDYAGTDMNGDGLGDTLIPYNSSGNITDGGDWHPLVGAAAPSGGGGGGTYPPGWDEPTPTVTATAVPGVTPGVTPPEEAVTTPTETAVAEETPSVVAEETPTKKKGIPGFTAVFAIAGLLAIAYAMMRRRD